MKSKKKRENPALRVVAVRVAGPSATLVALLKKYKGESLILRAIRNMAYKIGGHDGFTTEDFDGWLRMTRGDFSMHG